MHIGLGVAAGTKGPRTKDKVTFSLDTTLHRQFKAIAAECGVTMDVVVHNLIQAHVARVMYRKNKRAA